MENENPLANLSLNGHQKKLANELIAASKLVGSKPSKRKARKTAKHLSEYLCVRLDELGPARHQVEKILVEKMVADKLPGTTDDHELRFWLYRALMRIRPASLPAQWFSEKPTAFTSDHVFMMRAWVGYAHYQKNGMPETMLELYLSNLLSANPDAVLAAKELVKAMPGKAEPILVKMIHGELSKTNPLNSGFNLHRALEALESIHPNGEETRQLLETAWKKLEQLELPARERAKINMLQSTRRSIDQRLVRFTHGQYKPAQAIQK